MIIPILRNVSVDKSIRDQLRRAAVSISLNIAEGTSRFSKADRRNFYIISRGSTYECVAILDYLKCVNLLTDKDHTQFLSNLEEISKMLYAIVFKLGASKVVI